MFLFVMSHNIAIALRLKICYYVDMEDSEKRDVVQSLRYLFKINGIGAQEVIDVALEEGEVTPEVVEQTIKYLLVTKKVTPEFAEDIVRRLLKFRLITPEVLARIADIQDSVSDEVAAVGKVTDEQETPAPVPAERVQVPELSKRMVELGKHISDAFPYGVGTDALDVARRVAMKFGCPEAEIDWLYHPRGMPKVEGLTVEPGIGGYDYKLMRVNLGDESMVVAPKNVPKFDDFLRYYFRIKFPVGSELAFKYPKPTIHFRSFSEMLTPCQIDKEGRVIKLGLLT